MDDGAVGEHRSVVGAGLNREKHLSQHPLTGDEPARILANRLAILVFYLCHDPDRRLGFLRLWVDPTAAELNRRDAPDLDPRDANGSAALQAPRVVEVDEDTV